MVFFRRRRPGRHAEDGDVFNEPPAEEPVDDEEALEEYVGGLSGDEKPQREGGPYDVEEAPDDDLARVDFGSLQVPHMEGVEIQFKVSEEEVDGVMLVDGESALHLAAFAAPRTEGIWDETREELHKQLLSGGGSVEEAETRYGRELRARVRTPNGPADVRVLGFDGPRWMVRAQFEGRAAADEEAGASLLRCLDQLVVRRDKEPRPVGEALPLTLPPDVAGQVAEQAAATQGQADAGPAQRAPAQGKAAGGKAAGSRAAKGKPEGGRRDRKAGRSRRG